MFEQATIASLGLIDIWPKKVGLKIVTKKTILEIFLLKKILDIFDNPIIALKEKNKLTKWWMLTSYFLGTICAKKADKVS